MRVLLLAVCVTGAALAQERAPAPAEATARAAPAPEPAQGGGYLVGAEVLAGVVTGALLGGSYGADNAGAREGIYYGSIGGGLLLGSAAAVYQHFVPVHRGEAVLAGLGGVAGGLAGFGMGLALKLPAGPSLPWAVTLGTQVGMIAPLLLTAGGGSVSAGDVWLVTMGMVYATVVATVASTLWAAQPDAAFVALAPSLGFAVGAGLAAAVETTPGRVLGVGSLSLGVGLTTYYLGYLATKGDLKVAAAAGLIGLGGTLGTALLLTLLSPPSEPARATEKRAPPPSVLPTPMLLSSRGALVPGLGLRGDL